MPLFFKNTKSSYHFTLSLKVVPLQHLERLEGGGSWFRHRCCSTTWDTVFALRRLTARRGHKHVQRRMPFAAVTQIGSEGRRREWSLLSVGSEKPSVEVIRNFPDRQVEAGTFGAEFGRAWEGQVTRSESIVRGRLWYVQKFGLHAAGRREPVQGFKLWQNRIRFSFLKVTPVTMQGKKWITDTFFRPCLQNPERTNIPFSSRLP